jgi:hypothetical protein
MILIGHPRHDVHLQKLNDDCVSGLLRWNCFYPFREVIYGCEYPYVLHQGWRIYFLYKIQAPLHERRFDRDRFQWQGLQLSPSIKNMTLMATGKLSVYVCEYGGPIVTCPQNFMRGGFLVVMSFAVAFLEFFNSLFHVVFQQTT